ncbi:MAG: hypothetical protein WCH31_08000 [Actinomycetes bacterium]
MKRLVTAVACIVGLAIIGVATAGALPSRGVFIAGQSLAGVRLGDTMDQVKQRLGPKYVQCGSQCADPTWLFTYRAGEPLGMAVRFQKKKVVAVFTLGTPTGWKSSKGLKLFDPIATVYQYYTPNGEVRCVGFDALTISNPAGTSAVYAAAGVVYGFALVVPGMTVCQ